MSERPSMINRSASQRAEALRGNLQGLRDVDELLAEASGLKRDAAAEAERLVAEAQALAADVIGEAEGRAAAIILDARAAAEATSVRTVSALGEIEAGVRELGSHLEGALRSLDTLVETLQAARTGSSPVARLAQATLPPGASAQVVSEDRPDEMTSTGEQRFYEAQSRDDAGARPLGWLFRATPQG